MKEGNPNLIQNNEEEGKNIEKKEILSIKEKRKNAYAEAVEKMKQHDEAEKEAMEVLFREKLAQTGPEAAVGALELRLEAAKEQKEIYAEKGDPFAEEAWTARVQFLEGMKDMFCMYLDMQTKSPEFAKYIRDVNPWVETHLAESEKLVN